MNIKIFLRKENEHSDVPLAVKFGSIVVDKMITKQHQVISLESLEHTCDTQLSLARNEQALYETNRNHHSNKIFVDKVIIDDFWELDEEFYPPVTEFDEDYTQHIEKVGKDEWITNSLVNNTHLFFNGRLTWDIKYPVRRSFFKDYNR
tara:strand:+ start:1049 stop:1492 length:444 start_codon:yes stop_codon:yes gene_type:complete